MKHRHALVFSLLLPVVLPGCTTESASNRAQLSGTLNYRERIALPAKATATIALRDARVQSPYEAISVTVVQDPGSVPIAFTLNYDPRKIRPDEVYHLDATIAYEGKVHFEQRNFKVLTQGAPGDAVGLWLEMVK